MIAHKIYRQVNRSAVRQRQARYEKAHPEIRKKCEKNYRTKHGEVCRQRCREWYRKNLRRELERNRKKNAKQYAENREIILARNKLWRENNPASILQRGAKRRALKRQATINLQSIRLWMAKVLSKPSIRCYFCRQRTPTTQVHFDHIIALANGGAHSVENLCASCEPCNLSKGAKPLRLWTKIDQHFLEL